MPAILQQQPGMYIDNLYGDGHAAAAITELIKKHL
jgi:hypothetical protein